MLTFLFNISFTPKNGTLKILPGPSKKVTITTDEGTWMNLDVSPDGKTIVFDLLGDIYTIPVKGGKATCWQAAKPGKYSRVSARMAS